MYPIEKYYDKSGLIGNYDPPGTRDHNGDFVGPEGWVEGGDTLQRMAMLTLLLAVRHTEGVESNAIKWLDMLETSPGLYVRHPDKKYWYSDDNRMSRDQCFPLIICLGALGFKRRLFNFFIRHLMLRGGLFTTNTRRNHATKENHGTTRYTNPAPLRWYHKLILKLRIPFLPVPEDYKNYNWKLPDFTGLSFWGAYIRGFGLWWLYPLLCVLDLEFFINSIIKRFKNDHHVINHIVEATYNSYKYPTPLSWVANKFINDDEDMIKRMRDYFAPDRSPGFIGTAYEPKLKEIMGKGKIKC